MGVGVSDWRLARAVAAAGQLGVVSGVALDAVLARRLQCGDPGGDVRRALGELPLPGVAERIIRRYFVPGGIAAGQPFRPIPRPRLRPNVASAELTVAGNFVEAHLAKQGHDGLVGINYLEKIQLATPAAVYGAMLAGVDYVLMGAGIPAEIPALLDSVAAGGPGEVTVTVAGAAAGTRHTVQVDPRTLFGVTPAALARPRFLAIVSSAVLAAYLARTPASTPDGFVLETAGAGGHSAPPRGRLRLDARNEPVYGPRDEIDVTKVAALGLPFWLAGGQAGPGRLARARAVGADVIAHLLRS
jgi:NAD(P)H-dependent flavin oxidoreductase YrpB (nitropropane dioxygenase family)